jgi:beta-N-acetylhexosaminidase
MSLRELRRHVGRLAIVGFAGHSAPDELRRLVAEFDLGGVIYFARNVAGPGQVADLSREVVDLSKDWPLWISVDQEGGRVARLKHPFTEWPPAVTLGRAGDRQLAERFARALAAELRAVGITLDYAPVLDVHTNPTNPVIGDRAIAAEADEVARLGSVIIETLQAAGVAASAKHFPGHGDTSVDSHDALPIVEHDLQRLEAVELRPFRAAIDADVATVMTGHVALPALDPERPASLSSIVVSRLLKDTMGYDGVVLSDDLGMKAVSGTTDLGPAAVSAIGAGCDVVLLCNSTADEQVAVLEALIRATESGELPVTRVEDAFTRQRDVKARFRGGRGPAVALDCIGSAEHRAVAEEMAAWQ